MTARQRQLPSAVEHALFQIAQEGLWNAVRHARATQAWLSLAFAEDQVLLSVSDDGSGDPAVVGRYLIAATASPGSSGQGPARRGRHGLRNIAERAAELGGEVSLRRRRGGGLRISVRVPVQVAGAPAPGTTSGNTGPGNTGSGNTGP
ncbi:MAG: sensor histidine kinase [Trebonia sp.]